MAIPFVDQVFSLSLHKQMLSLQNIKAATFLRRLIIKENYDLIITHTSLAAFFTRLAVKNLRDRPPICDVMHGYLFDDKTQFIKRSVLQIAEMAMAKETELLLTMNNWDYQYALNRRLAGRIEMIPGMGVEYSRLDSVSESSESLRRRFGIPNKSFIMVYAAEFSERKNQRMLIDAMPSLPENVILALPGDGDLRAECIRHAQKMNVSKRVLFPGYVSDVAPWYRLADIAVSSSRSEGLPFNILEAMYCGLPVVASMVKGHTDLLEEIGLLFPHENIKAFTKDVMELMNDPVLYKRIAVREKERVCEYSLDRVLPAVMDKYLSVIPKK